MLKRLAMLGLLLPAMAWGGEPAGAGPAPGERALLDRDVPGIIAQAGVPSVSIAQIKGGRVVLTAAYGAQQAGVPATPATLYNIASLTKQITAEVILRAASRGEVSLDEPMYRVWTDPDIAGDERRKLLTLRLVLSHRSGFPNWRDHKTGLAFERAPGEGWGYSGEGYVYAAKFTETKIGRPFEDLAQAYLFEPAGMISTAYTQKPWYAGRSAIPTDASGKSLVPELTHRYIAADLAYTTAGDYAAFMTQVLRDRDLTPALAAARSQVAADTWAADCAGAKAAACPCREGVGLGWLVLDFGEAKLLMHTGKDAGVFTFAYLDPATGDGAVILTNSDKGGNIVIPILERLGARAAFVRYLKSEAS